MPDPRHPQQPRPPRHPAPQPQRGQPAQPAPVPTKPSAMRPVRQLAPSEEAPPLEKQRKLKKGESYWVVGQRHLERPLKGKIVRLSNEPGKAIGIEFDQPIGGLDKEGQLWGVNHTCDGHGKQGHCLYVRPDQVLDEKEMASFNARQAEARAAETKWEEFDELTVGPTAPPSVPAEPAPNGHSEKMTIGPGDVGKLELKKEEDKDEDEDEEDEEDDDK